MSRFDPKTRPPQPQAAPFARDQQRLSVLVDGLSLLCGRSATSPPPKPRPVQGGFLHINLRLRERPSLPETEIAGISIPLP